MKAMILIGATMAVAMPSNAMAQSDAEREAAQANFRQADANGDRRLSRSEFRTFIDANAEDGLGRASAVRRLGAYDRAFDRADRNGNGVVTPAELSVVQSD
ncbi:EF-hand domain-containing protein [Parasphingopyxis sp.]|uniref:EF-hand domain-containing protein n=1 Tax=Parasphingopyxis sp. TaxID=1920299 RepID=UPI0026078C2F|nr:EF-hand domain-containing protein [Parasphingopyxis sp.]